jgi:hypothetical protein
MTESYIEEVPEKVLEILGITDPKEVHKQYVPKEILDKLSHLNVDEIYASMGDDENAGFTDEQVALLEKHINDNNYDEFNQLFELNKKLTSKIEEVARKMETLLTEEDIFIINNCIISDEDLEQKFLENKKDFLHPNPMVRNLFELQAVLKMKKYSMRKGANYSVDESKYINYQLPVIDVNSSSQVPLYYNLGLAVMPSDEFPFDCEYNQSGIKLSSSVPSYDKNSYINKCAMFIGRRTGFYFDPQVMSVDEISAYHVPTKFTERTSFSDHDNDNAAVMRQSILRKMDNRITID